MNNVKSVCNNCEPMSYNVKKDLLLFGGSLFDENKNNIIVEAKNSGRFSGSSFFGFWF